MLKSTLLLISFFFLLISSFTFLSKSSQYTNLLLQMLSYECLHATFALLIYNVEIVFSNLLDWSKHFCNIPDMSARYFSTDSVEVRKFYAHLVQWHSHKSLRVIRLLEFGLDFCENPFEKQWFELIFFRETFKKKSIEIDRFICHFEMCETFNFLYAKTLSTSHRIRLL